MNVSTSWFENYIVRYLIGTIIGSICSILIVSAIYSPESIHASLELGANKIIDGKIDSTLFSILALLGLLYCYISSTPITIIHAARMLGALPARKLIEPKNMWIFWWFSLGATAIFIWKSDAPPSLWIGMVFCLPAIYILFAQWAPLVATLKNLKDISAWHPISWIDYLLNHGHNIKENQFKNYYHSLAKERVKDEQSKDLRSSYSHLREHSNSIFIVLLEISLAALITALCMAMKDSTWEVRAFLSTLLLMMWMTPTVFVWGIANSLEESLSKRNGELKPEVQHPEV